MLPVLVPVGILCMLSLPPLLLLVGSVCIRNQLLITYDSVFQLSIHRVMLIAKRAPWRRGLYVSQSEAS